MTMATAEIAHGSRWRRLSTLDGRTLWPTPATLSRASLNRYRARSPAKDRLTRAATCGHGRREGASPR